MDTSARSALLVYTVVAAGINSGAFFIFSNFVMASLGRLAPADGARAMQEMNRNNRLDEVDPNTAHGRTVWAKYLVSWTRGNHVRALTSTLSVVCLLLATSA